MKKQEFKKLIREEVISTLQDVLPALMAEAMVIQQEQVENFDTPNKNPQKKKMSFKDVIGLVENTGYESSTSTDTKPIKYTDNHILNEVLNNTRGGLPQQNQMLPPAYQMGMQHEEASIMSEVYDGVSDDMMFENINSSISNDFGDKMSKFTQNTEPSSKQVMSEEEAIAYAESFGNGNSDVGVGEISMDFINSIGKKAGAVVRESTKKSKNAGYSNIDFTKQ